MIDYIKKQHQDFKKWGWSGVLTKATNIITGPIINIKITNVLKKSKREKIKTVLIINGAEKTVSEVHRVFHLKDKLDIIGIYSFILTDNMLNRHITKKISDFDMLYIHRSYHHTNINNLINKYKKNNKIIIYDIDDLIFDKSQIKKINFLKKSDIYTRRHFIKNANNYLKIMKIVDLVITPTDYLSKYIKDKYHLKTDVLRNHLDEKNLSIGKKIFLKNKNITKKITTIGYFAGTKTHKYDFKLIEKSLSKILKNNPNVNLKIVGDSLLKKYFKKNHKQIFVYKKVTYKKLMKLYSGVDINLAPSELNNSFCESKSELKYFFAGSCGIPTIASATNAFRHVIKNGVNGYICNKSKDWDDSLKLLINNKEKCLLVGMKAYNHVYKTYSPFYQSQELKKILKNIDFI